MDLRTKFTTDSDSVQYAIEHLPLGVNDSLLYDAMAKGISMLEERPAVRRRIMLVIGEAQDSGSESRLGEVLRQAQLANVTIYSIGLSTAMADLRAKPDHVNDSPDLMALAVFLVKTGKNALTANSLAVASKATGGLHVDTMRDRSIEKAIDEIGGELHAQYTIGYRPVGDDPEGYHEIKVVVDRPNVSVRTRPGYYVAPPSCRRDARRSIPARRPGRAGVHSRCVLESLRRRTSSRPCRSSRSNWAIEFAGRLSATFAKDAFRVRHRISGCTRVVLGEGHRKFTRLHSREFRLLP